MLKKILTTSIFINVKKKILFILIISLLSIFLGSWWAQQELDWGGWWNWDFVEIISLNVLVFIILNLHKLYNNLTLTLINLFIMCLLIILFSTFIRYNVFPSIHNFLGVLDLGIWLVIIEVVSFLLLLGILFFHYVGRSNLNSYSNIYNICSYLSHWYNLDYNSRQNVINFMELVLKIVLFTIITYIIGSVFFFNILKDDLYKECYIIRLFFSFFLVFTIIYISTNVKNNNSYSPNNLPNNLSYFLSVCIQPIIIMLVGVIRLGLYVSGSFLVISTHTLLFIFILYVFIYGLEFNVYSRFKSSDFSWLNINLNLNSIKSLKNLFIKYDYLIISNELQNVMYLKSSSMRIREVVIDIELRDTFFELINDKNYLSKNLNTVINLNPITNLLLFNLIGIFIIIFMIIILFIILKTSIEKKISNLLVFNSNYLLAF